MADLVPEPTAGHDADAAALDGHGAANIFDAEEVFREDDTVADAAPGPGAAAPPEAAEPDDGYAPDDALGAGDPDGVVLRYDGGDAAPWGLPCRDDLVAESSAAVSANLRRHLEAGRPMFFMPTDFEETNEYSGGYPTYALRLFGVLMDGSKADVLVAGIPVFFDVRVPAGGDPARFDAHLRGLLAEANVAGVRVENVHAFPGRGYCPDGADFKRVHTPNLAQRKKALAAAREAGLETASDDRGSYYRKAAREGGLPLTDWAVLGDYEYTAGPTEKSPLCAHVFRVPVTAYRPFVDPMAPKEKREAAARTRDSTPQLAKDRTLVLAWDIETHSDRGTGDVPTAEHAEDDCFMICLTVHWKDDAAPVRQICLVDVEAAPDRRWVTVVCGTPLGVLKAFALCWRALAPDVVAGFNDSVYDWPFVVEKARRLGVLGWMVATMSASPRRGTSADSAMRWNYQADRKIKITAEETFISSYLKVPGAVPIDVRVVYRKFFPKSETTKEGSLKFYLEISKLPSKADMPVKRMWRYYREARAAARAGAPDPAAAEHMRHVAHYCVIDALSCQRLLVRRGVVDDYRAVAALSFVSLFDSHYYAGGMKVCNLLGVYAARRNTLISMIPRDVEVSGKYPGAYVFPPEKGVTPDPDRLAAVDAAVARLRRAAGAGPAGALEGAALAALEAALAGGDPAAAAPGMPEVAEAAAAVAAAFAEMAGDYPVTGLDFASLYPSLIMTYNYSPEKILLTAEEAAYWVARGRTVQPIEFPYGGRVVRGWSVRHENRPEDIGLYPAVLIDLFNKRAEMKVALGVPGAVKELIEVVHDRAERDRASVAEALRRVRADAAAEAARTAAALAPGAPPPPISPGSNLAEEVADLKRLSRLAADQVAGVDRLYALAGGAGDDAAVEAATAAEYARVCFDWTCANTKQAALKVYMNTFYGEAGNSLSPFFMLELAGGVTSSGQYNIKLVAEFVRSRGFRIKYGDTDSLYLVAPAKYFAGANLDYAAGRLTREEYWSALVRITIRALNAIRDEVNAMLAAENGTRYLTMAYEEVLYPVVFTGKKKYFGTPHLNEVNFRAKLFIRGIDVVKQGQPGLAREIGFRIMRACVAIDNARSVRAVVEDVLRDAVVNGGQWGFGHFVKTAAWKPHKNNVPVHRFVARMRAQAAVQAAENDRRAAAGLARRPALYELPEPGERFSYVIVELGDDFNLRGCKAAQQKGDRMEYAHVAKALGLRIDVANYISSGVAGLCARFINGEAQFQPVPRPPDEKKADAASQKAAKKYLEDFVKRLGGVDAAVLRKRGLAYRRAYGQASAAIRGPLAERVGPAAAGVLHGDWLDYELLLADDGGGDAVSAAVGALWAAAGELAAEVAADDWCEPLARALGIGPDGRDLGGPAPPARGPSPRPAGASPGPASPRGGPPQRGGAPAPATRLFAAAATATRRRPEAPTLEVHAAAALDRMEAAIRAELAARAPVAAAVAARYEADLSRLVRHCRLGEHAAHPEIGAGAPGAAAPAPADAPAEAAPDFLLGITAADAAPLLALRSAWFDAVGLQATRLRRAQFARHLAALRERRLGGAAAAPGRADRGRAVAAAAAALRVSGEVALV